MVKHRAPLLPDLVKKKTVGKHVSMAFAPLILGTSALAGVVSYEGNEFPEGADPPWERSGTFDCDRWLSNGWFFQAVDLGAWAPPPGGEQDKYQRFIGEFIGLPTFFIEWRLHTNGDSSEIVGTAPASLVASGVPSAGVSYHFTIAKDLVRLIRGNFNPIVYVAVDEHVPHTYRLELYQDELYVWYVDNRVVDSGQPSGAFPTVPTNVISFRAKSEYLTRIFHQFDRELK